MSSQLLINEPPLQVLPTLAKTIGLNEAIILQQVHYWLNPQFNKNFHEGKHWVHNTFDQWEQQFAFWSIRTIQRIINNLEDNGLLLSYVTRDFKKTKHYSLDYTRLNLLCPPGCNDNPSTNPQAKIPNTIEPMNNQGFRPFGQNDGIENDNLSISNTTECRHRERQVDVIDDDKLSSFHYTENTNPENTTENTPPPLSPPPQILTQETQEEEENQKSNLGLESQNSIPDQTLSPPTSLALQPLEVKLTDHAHHHFSEMIEIWNQLIQNKLSPGQEVRLTDKRKTHLSKFLNQVFCNILSEEKIIAWKNYCTLIAKSKFLSGKNPNGFKVTLDWALIPDNAYKVLEGAIYDKPETNKKQQEDLPWEDFSAEIVRSVPSSKYLVQWVKMSVTIAQFIGQPKYRHWFSRVMLSEITDTAATFLVEGQITKDIIVRQYSSELRCAVQKLYPTVHQLEFKVVSNLGDNE